MELLIIISLLYILPLLFIKKNNNELNKGVFNKKESHFIKGILCLFVMVHNLGLDYIHTNFPDRNYTGLLWVSENITESIGGIAVGVFFFLSSCGLLISYQRYGNQFLKKLLLKNFIKLYLTAVFINTLEYLLFFRKAFDTKDLILRILNLDIFNNFNRMNRHGWFISSILLLYLVFALVFYTLSKFKTKYKIKIATYIVVFITLSIKALSLIVDRGGMYTRELPCFAIGLLYTLYYPQINPFLKKYSQYIVSVCIMTYVIGVFFYEPVAAWATCVLITTIFTKYTFSNTIIEKLGKICLGVYLFLHLSTLIYWDYFLSNAWLWIIINFATIIALSIVLFILTMYIEKTVEKIKQLRRGV